MPSYAESGLEKIESYVATLPGVSRCSIVTAEDGAPAGLRVVLKPGRSPVQMPTEISAFLDEVLDVQLGPERIDVEVDARDGGRGGQEGFWAGGRERRLEDPDAGSGGTDDRPTPDEAPPRAPEAPPVGAAPEGGGTLERRAGDRRNGERRVEERRSGERRTAGARATDDAAATAPEEPVPTPRTPEEAPTTLRLDRYGIFGGGGAGVELRIRVAAGEATHQAALRTSSLAELTAAEVVDATLRAAERAVDRLPVEARCERILVLESRDVEDVTVRSGPFVAVTVAARRRGGTGEATGFRAGTSDEPEAAARAALDAVRRLLEGPKGNDAPGDPGEARAGVGEAYDPFAAWD